MSAVGNACLLAARTESSLRSTLPEGCLFAASRSDCRTHSATVSALAVSVGLREGFDTSLFAVAAVFAFIVMYDAAGIRRAAGLHAQLLNQLMEELGQVIRLGPQRGPLKELLGHTYLEVAVGALIGGLVALGAYRLFPAA